MCVRNQVQDAPCLTVEFGEIVFALADVTVLVRQPDPDDFDPDACRFQGKCVVHLIEVAAHVQDGVMELSVDGDLRTESLVNNLHIRCGRFGDFRTESGCFFLSGIDFRPFRRRGERRDKIIPS